MVIHKGAAVEDKAPTIEMAQETATLTMSDGTIITLPVHTPKGGGQKCIDVRGL